MGEVVNVILDAGMAVFHRVAPALVSSPSSSGQVLHSLLYPETFRFRLESIDDKPSIVPIAPDEAYTCESDFEQDIDSDFQVDSELPQYSSQEI